MAAYIAILITWIIGFIAIGTVWPHSRSIKQDLLLIASLGIGFGFGITSFFYFFTSLILNNTRLAISIEETILVITCSYYLFHRMRKSETAKDFNITLDKSIYAILVSIFIQACVVTGSSIAKFYKLNPWGDWDGWAIWNLHAKFIITGGKTWATLLHNPALEWSHPDYPLLIPLSVARIWSLIGTVSPLGSQLVAASFAIGSLGLLISVVTLYKNKLLGLIVGAVLLGTPSFIRLTAAQCADIPLGYFILAAVSLILLSQLDHKSDLSLQLLASVFTGFAAWTKNEGMLFTLVVVCSWIALNLRRKRIMKSLPLLTGLLITLVPLLIFKLFLAAQNDLTSSHFLSRLSSLWNINRHITILTYLKVIILKFGEWSIIPFYLMGLALIGKEWRELKDNYALAVSIILLMLAGYYIVYLLTPLDLVYHLSTSFNRLLLQLWPTLILIWGMSCGYSSKSIFPIIPLYTKTVHPVLVLSIFTLINTSVAVLIIYLI